MPIEPASLAAQRYRRVVERMRDDWIAKTGRDHGWKAELGRQLGVSGQFLGYIENGEREAGLDAVELAISRLGIAPEYFHSTRLGADPDHRRFLARRGETRVVLDELPGLAAYEQEHGKVADDEREHVLGLAASEGPDVFDLYQVTLEIEAYRRRRRRAAAGQLRERPVDPENEPEPEERATVSIRRGKTSSVLRGKR